MEQRSIMASTKNLSVYFKLPSIRKKLWVRAVNDISLSMYKGEVLGLVGESGSGKSTYGRALLRLNEAQSGQIFFQDEEITHLSTKEMRPLRKEMQMVFQDPNSSLNPRMKLMDIIREPLYVNKLGTKQAQEQAVRTILEHVQLPQDSLGKFPHQLSGGQRQRIAIARALVTRPRFLVADEPVSALDVSVQAQIINLLSDLREELGLTILMISHDLSVVQYFADRVAVMYLGKLVEVGTVEEVFNVPAHPYTKALLDAVPEPDPTIIKATRPIDGDMPSPVHPPSGCVFRTRCPLAKEDCERIVPELKEMTPGHLVACILNEQGGN
ncbi:ABC transporter ATP-binding protein [Paenibacillus sp. FSL H8-0548]|uniref:ABC transporter ATP-binding protein n=1 Tax=Paenibacillus sp. FSL H8-0548 TaxID=1920422 RepID=UPI0021167226|nr:ABC transporter ATP-binding protein [Paenibacillus sp. FSL H8-0548]